MRLLFHCWSRLPPGRCTERAIEVIVECLATNARDLDALQTFFNDGIPDYASAASLAKLICAQLQDEERSHAQKPDRYLLDLLILAAYVAKFCPAIRDVSLDAGCATLVQSVAYACERQRCVEKETRLTPDIVLWGFKTIM